MRLADFGAFVKLAPGLEGLVHISNISTSRVEHPQDVLAVGDEIKVRLLSLDVERQRLDLGIRQVESPDEEKKNHEPREERVRPPKPSGSLGTMADLFGGLQLK